MNTKTSTVTMILAVSLNPSRSPGLNRSMPKKSCAASLIIPQNPNTMMPVPKIISVLKLRL